MDQAEEHVLAFMRFPKEHWPQLASTNSLERLNKEIKRRSRVIGIFPNNAAIIRLMGPAGAKRLIMSGKFFAVDTLAQWEFLDETCARADLDARAQAGRKTMQRCPPQMIKRSINRVAAPWMKPSCMRTWISGCWQSRVKTSPRRSVHSWKSAQQCSRAIEQMAPGGQPGSPSR